MQARDGWARIAAVHEAGATAASQAAEETKQEKNLKSLP